MRLSAGNFAKVFFQLIASYAKQQRFVAQLASNYRGPL